MTNREDAHLLSGAYAVHAVDAEEAALVESAMQESEELHHEVVGLTDTAVALGLAVPEEAPPAALRGRLLDAIATTPQLPVEDTVEAEPETPAPMPAGDHVVPKRRRRRRPVVWVALAAAAVLLFGGGFLLQRTLLEPQSEVVAVWQAPDVQQARASVASGGSATVFWSSSEHRTAVVLSGVKVPSGKVLQLWSVRGSTITSAGLYEPGGQKYVLLTGTPSSGESLAVTVEPQGGSAQPTTRPIVSVKLNA
ncbi:anti-sigma factor domain-containing protein [Amnibacterium sp.]|uniref:anti-sigma factor n=1 Tax=Amnibacterium sp. TaxID=1872496 RepID=UPI003F7B9DD4